MKKLAILLLALLTCSSYAQRGRSLDVSGSNFVVVKFQDFSKDGSHAAGIKFINADTGKITKVAFDSETAIVALDHVQLEPLAIDVVVLITNKTEKKNSALIHESTIATFSPDGKRLNTVSMDHLVSDFVINKKTGRIIVITSSNRMKSSGTTDEQVETIYDLKTLKRI